MKKSQAKCGVRTRKGQGKGATPHRCGRFAGHKGQHICGICESVRRRFVWNDKKDKPRYVVSQRCGKSKEFPSLSDARTCVRKMTTIFNTGDVYIIKKEAGKQDVVVY